MSCSNRHTSPRDLSIMTLVIPFLSKAVEASLCYFLKTGWWNWYFLTSMYFHSWNETPFSTSHWNFSHTYNFHRNNRNEKKHRFIDHPVSACLPAMARVVGKFPSAFHLLFLRRCTMWSKPFWSTVESGINVGLMLINFGGFSSGYVLIKGGMYIKQILKGQAGWSFFSK